MAITNQTRKYLWTRAHNMCALCRKPLTEKPGSGEFSNLILGEEAHIIARSEAGPRGRAGDRTDIDGYANLILLCADDHTRVDSQPELYSVDFLKKARETHEEWAEQRLGDGDPIRIEARAGEENILLAELRTGEAVWGVVAGTMFSRFASISNDDRPDASDAADDFLSQTWDWAEMSSTIRDEGFRSVREAQREIQKLLDALSEHELRVFGRRTIRTLRGGLGAPEPVHYCELVVIEENETLTATGNFGRGGDGPSLAEDGNNRSSSSAADSPAPF